MSKRPGMMGRKGYKKINNMPLMEEDQAMKYICKMDMPRYMGPDAMHP